MTPTDALTGATHDAFHDACVMPPMTRPKSLTHPHRQRSGKRVICVMGASDHDASQIDVVARARMRAHKDINQGNRQTRHHPTTTAARR